MDIQQPAPTPPSNPPLQFPQLSQTQGPTTSLSPDSSELPDVFEIPPPTVSDFGAKQQAEANNTTAQQTEVNNGTVQQVEDNNSTNVAQQAEDNYNNNHNNHNTVQQPEDSNTAQQPDNNTQKRYSDTDILGDTKVFWDKKGYKYGYKFETFFKAWLLERAPSGRHWAGSRLQSLRRILNDPAVRERLSEAGIEFKIDGEKKQEMADTNAFRHELLALVTEPAFKAFDPRGVDLPDVIPQGVSQLDADANPDADDDDDDDNSNINNENSAVRDARSRQWIDRALRDAWPRLQVKSPKLAAFLTSVLHNKRNARPPRRNVFDAPLYNTSDDSCNYPTRAYMIASLMLGAIAPRQSTTLPMSIGLYLHNTGVPRRVIETLARFGVCSGYKPILKQRKLNCRAEMARAEASRAEASQAGLPNVE